MNAFCGCRLLDATSEMRNTPLVYFENSKKYANIVKCTPLR